MNDFYDEVQDYRKQEVIGNLIYKYGKYVILIAVAIVIISAVFVYQNNKTKQFQEEYSLSFIQALNKNNLDELEKIAAIKASGFSDITNLNLAFQLEKQNKLGNAFELYQKLFKESNFAEIRNYSIYRMGVISISNNNVEMKTQFQNYAKNLTSDAFKDLILLVAELVKITENKDKALIIAQLKNIKQSPKLNPELLTLIEAVSNILR